MVAPIKQAADVDAMVKTRRVAEELGFSPATVRLMAPKLGGVRRTDRSAYRFPLSRVLEFKGDKREELTSPKATNQNLAQEVHHLTVLGRQREIRLEQALKKIEQLEERLDRIEKANANFTRA